MHVDPHLERGTILTDSKRLQQVLKNLLSNAFKFTEQGGVRLERLAGQRRMEQRSPHPEASGAGGRLHGDRHRRGHPARQSRRSSLEAFQQADASTEPQVRRHGLGLAISRELANLLGGEIQLQSSPGRGSTFTLYLPLRHHRPRQRAQVERMTRRLRSDRRPGRAPAGQHARARARRPRRDRLGDSVLLASSRTTSTTRASWPTLRARPGFKVVVASRGVEALELARRFLPRPSRSTCSCPTCWAGPC